MRRSCRSVPRQTRRGAAGPALAVAAAAAICVWPAGASAQAQSQGPAEQPGRLAVSLVPAMSRAWRDGAPLTLAVTIENPTPRLECTVETWLGERANANIARMPLRLGRGTFLHFLYPLSADAYADRLFVRLVGNDGRPMVERELPVVPSATKLWVCAMLARRPADVPELQNRQRPEDIVLTTLYGSELLPDQWYGYSAFDVLLWDINAKAAMGRHQTRALSDWVRTGGRLVLFDGGGGSGKRSAPLAEFAPLVEAFPASGGSVAAPQEMRLGLGSATATRAGVRELLAVRTRQDAMPLLGLKAEPEEHPAAASATDYLMQELASKAGHMKIPVRAILVMSLCYIVVVSLVDYAVLRKLRRLTWTWATFPAFIALFASFSYLAFYRKATGTVQRYEVLVQDRTADGTGRALAFSCLRHRGSKPVTMSLEPSHLVTPWGLEDAAYRTSRRGLFGRSVPPYGMPQHTTTDADSMSVVLPGREGMFRFSAEEWPLRDTRPVFEAKLRKTSNNGLEGSLRNLSQTAFAQIFVSYQGAFYTVDDQLNLHLIPQSAHPQWVSSGHGDILGFLRPYPFRPNDIVVLARAPESEETHGGIRVSRECYVYQVVHPREDAGNE